MSQLEELQRALDAIDALHQPTSHDDWRACQCCTSIAWPCPTARLLHPAPEEDK